MEEAAEASAAPLAQGANMWYNSRRAALRIHARFNLRGA